MGPFYQTLAERVELAGRLIVPYSGLAVLFVISIVAVPYPLAVVLRAPFVLMALYYWSIYRPTLIPVWLVFAAGLALDLLTGAPAGLNALTFVICRILIFDQRRFLMAQNFLMIWLGFCLLDMGVYMLQWVMFSAAHAQWMPLDYIWSSLALGALLFPVVSVFLHATHKILPNTSNIKKSTLSSPSKNARL